MAQRRPGVDLPRWGFALLCVLTLAATRAGADETPPPLVAQCISCHGNGMTRPADRTIPIIAGQQYEYLLAALKAYRNDERRGDQAAAMTGIAKALPLEDLPLAAGFYSQLRSVRW